MTEETMTDSATAQAFDLMNQLPTFGLFVFATLALLWVQRYWQSKDAELSRAASRAEREAFEAALDRVLTSHRETVRDLGDQMKEAVGMLRETVNTVLMRSASS